MPTEDPECSPNPNKPSPEVIESHKSGPVVDRKDCWDFVRSWRFYLRHSRPG